MRALLTSAALLAFLLVASLSFLPATQDDDVTYVISNGMKCGPEGTATSKKGKAIDSDKNRFKSPGDLDIDLEVSLPAMLAPGQDKNRFNTMKAATVRGFVINVISGGKETCNCGSDDPDEKDSHIELSLSKVALPNQRVIVEVTQRLRILKKKMGDDWRTDSLSGQIKGKWVEVTGWLLFDWIHVKEAENTNPGNPSNWRATCWEIHPVTSITVLDEAPTEAANFQPKSFSALQRLHATHVMRSETGRTSLAEFHKRHLSEFDKTELAEAEEEAKARRPNP
jgi:hypothetical protein